MPKKTSNSDIITIKASVLRCSFGGVYVENNKNVKKWLPKSQITILAESSEIKLPVWLAMKNNLI